MNRLANMSERRFEKLFFSVLFLLALMMTLKYFPGIENSSTYAGNVFQAIYPDAFPGDPHIGAERSKLEKVFQLSLFYLGPKLMGEIWLDDRFGSVVCLFLVFISLLGIDRLVRLAGVTDVLPRLVIQLIFMRDHQYLTLTATFANQPDLHHTAFAIPVTIWLIYATLARKRLWVILGLSVLLASFSIKMAPHAIAFCLIIAAVNGSSRERLVVVSVFSAALAVFVYVVVYALPVPEADKLILWDLIYHKVENYDSNPFYPRPDVVTMVKKNVVIGAIFIAAVLAPIPQSAAVRGAKIYVSLGVLMWLIGGLYFSFAPDALKLVHVFPFSLTRALRWPQTMAYLLIMVSVFYWLKEHQRWRDFAGATFIFLGLLVVGPGNHELWAGLFTISVFTVLALQVFRHRTFDNPSGHLDPAPWIAGRYSMYLAQALALTIGIAFVSTIWKKLPEWRTLVVHGVHGNSPVKEWIGVAEYVRENTPFDAVVLPLEEEGNRILVRRYLASRGGRTIPLFKPYTSIFDLQVWRLEAEQTALVGRLREAVWNRDWRAAVSELDGLLLKPDYLILPHHYVDEEFLETFPFVGETKIGKYAILKRKTPMK